MSGVGLSNESRCRPRGCPRELLPEERVPLVTTPEVTAPEDARGPEEAVVIPTAVNPILLDEETRPEEEPILPKEEEVIPPLAVRDEGGAPGIPPLPPLPAATLRRLAAVTIPVMLMALLGPAPLARIMLPAVSPEATAAASSDSNICMDPEPWVPSRCTLRKSKFGCQFQFQPAGLYPPFIQSNSLPKVTLHCHVTQAVRQLSTPTVTLPAQVGRVLAGDSVIVAAAVHAGRPEDPQHGLTAVYLLDL